MEQPHNHLPLASTSSSSNTISRSIPTPQVGEDEDHRQEADVENSGPPQEEQQPQPFGLAYRVNISVSDVAGVAGLRDDVWSCLIVLVALWFLAASVTLILGIFGSVNLQLGPNCSRLVRVNSFFVQYIQAEVIDEPRPGAVLYGFYEPPPLNVEITWTQRRDAIVPIESHKEWVYYLNKGSKVDISYTVTPSSMPLSLVIAQARESLFQWIDDPSHPNSTSSWNIISGNGTLQQHIPTSSNYYIAAGNLNSEDVEVKLSLTVQAMIYNTTQAYYRCSISDRLCSFKLLLLGTSTAILTTPGHTEATENDNWYVKLSYGPRWITFVIGTGFTTVLILVVLRILSMFQTSSPDTYPVGQTASERTPLLPQKDDDTSSWGSSYESVSHDEDLEEWFATNLDGKQIPEGENPSRLCVICFDSPRDCFFLPCGHCAACFACGARIAEEAGVCPICRRNMKKVRKVYTV